MPVVPAIATGIRNEIIRILQQDITWQAQAADLNVVIQPDAVVFQKTRAQYSREGQQDQQNIDIPGILVSKPMATRVNPEEWTNEIDLWHRRFEIQIVDRDEYMDTDRQDTWDKWEEQIISAFMFNCLTGAVVPATTTWVMSTASAVQDLDERRWIRAGMCVTSIELDIRASQPRGIIA